MITITRQTTIIKRRVKIYFLFSIFIKIVFTRYNNNNNVFIKKIIKTKSIFNHQLIAINHSKINTYFFDRCRNSSSLSKYCYKIKTRQIFNRNRNFFDKIITYQMIFAQNKNINRKITKIEIFKVNQKYIMTKKKNYDMIVNENESYQKKYHDESKHDVIINETKFVNEKSKYNEKIHNYFVKTLIKQTKIYICRRCSIEFYFNNKFHKHVRFCKNSLSIKNKSTIIDEFHVFVIQSNVASNSQSKLKFRF